MKKQYILLGLVVCMIVMSGIVIAFQQVEAPIDPFLSIRTISNEQKQFGKTAMIEERGASHFFYAVYPDSDEMPLNEVMLQYLLRRKKEMRQETITIDYQSEVALNRFISVVFEEKCYDDRLKVVSTEAHAFHYDKKEGVLLELDDIFKSSLLTELRTKGILEDNSVYVIKDQGVEVQTGNQKHLLLFEEYKRFVLLEDEAIPKEEEMVADDIRTLDVNRPMIAFTFDDGPGDRTQELIDLFKQYDGRATFFFIGDRANQPRYHDTIRKLSQAGFELGNHSTSHIDMSTLDIDGILKEFETTQSIVYKICGESPTAFRPPYGSVSQLMKDVLPLEMTMWNIDTKDWESKNAEMIKDETLPYVRNGSIVLLHDIYGSSIDAAKEMVPILAKQGYQFVSISEMRYYHPEVFG